MAYVGNKGKPRGVRPTKLTGDDLILITRLARAGRSTRGIAKALSTPERSISHGTIVKFLREARTPNEDVKMAIAALRMDAVEAWETAMHRGARDGRHAPAKDLLIASGTISSDHRSGVVIVIGNGVASVDTLPRLPIIPAGLLPEPPAD